MTCAPSFTGPFLSPNFRSRRISVLSQTEKIVRDFEILQHGLGQSMNRVHENRVYQ
jgi:hypothetical protein